MLLLLMLLGCHAGCTRMVVHYMTANMLHHQSHAAPSLFCAARCFAQRITTVRCMWPVLKHHYCTKPRAALLNQLLSCVCLS